MSEFGGLASSSKLTGAGVTEVTNQITLAAHLVTKKLCTPQGYIRPLDTTGAFRPCWWSYFRPGDPTPTAGVLLGSSGERVDGYGAEGCVRRGIFYLEKSGCVPACVDAVQVQTWRP
eukprot:scaffold4342_cov34-Attheya_sp.AAC.1